MQQRKDEYLKVLSREPNKLTVMFSKDSHEFFMFTEDKMIVIDFNLEQKL